MADLLNMQKGEAKLSMKILNVPIKNKIGSN